MDIKEKITEQINASPVVLYMKGSPQFPQCGFSSLAVEILKRCNVKKKMTVDVLLDADVRQGIKEYSNWPTIPQLYISGEFVGGSDIMREMYESGELAQMIPPEATVAE
ncbi:MAG: Grx4 family monothiol glutaredoxin [Candidatus Zeuxoniibacter abyssi]|nr:MAG: Grx4 family monothiol glutaredoxin [Candidatus Persebacteraceae bacterium AB1(2)]